MAQQDQDNLIREVDESLRQERTELLWKKHSASIIGAAIALVLATFGYVKWQEWKVERAGAMGARYFAALEALENKKVEDGEKALRDLASGAPIGYRALAKIRLAALEAERGKGDVAVKIYDDLAKEGQLDVAMRDFARMKAAMLRVDSADFTEMQNRLNDLRDGNNTYHTTARELLGLSAWKHGKYADAEKEFQLLLGDLSIPQATRGRAEVLLQMIADAQGDKPPAEKAETKTPAPATKTETAPPKSN